MELNNTTIGIGITGSFCTFDKTIEIIKMLKEQQLNIIPIMSYNAYNNDSRFGDAIKYIKQIEEISNNKILKTINAVEPIGPKNLLDILMVIPCTGNTLSKIANAISDTPITCAVKSQLRNNKPVLLAISTNDGLSGNAKNIGELLNKKNIYFVPFKQDDYIKKPNSLSFNHDYIIESIEKALNKIQIQPILC